MMMHVAVYKAYPKLLGFKMPNKNPCYTWIITILKYKLVNPHFIIMKLLVFHINFRSQVLLLLSFIMSEFQPYEVITCA